MHISWRMFLLKFSSNYFSVNMAKPNEHRKTVWRSTIPTNRDSRSSRSSTPSTDARTRSMSSPSREITFCCRQQPGTSLPDRGCRSFCPQYFCRSTVIDKHKHNQKYENKKDKKWDNILHFYSIYSEKLLFFFCFNILGLFV